MKKEKEKKKEVDEEKENGGNKKFEIWNMKGWIIYEYFNTWSQCFKKI